MTGLKSGSGDDLWGDDTDEKPDTQDEQTSSESSSDNVNSTPAEQQEPTEGTEPAPSDSGKMTGGSSQTESDGSGSQQPYIVRRAVQDRSVQFEREERLTFFVHDDVVDGERELLSEAEAAVGRSVPKFDLREAVYRAALRNREDVLVELVRMGYSIDEK
ncbi:hypothetical protein [Salinigranum rubrum]|uniref:hypothetical protein n=1 Tax=Salinigranum rubrum TaxID=755307 RepID=UPI0013A542F5|nr:hypothetical protein [Salinigranum rubrum]